jgi:hypothetical protein
MTQTEKDLLLKDLCGRLPYGVKITVNDRVETLEGINVLDTTVEYDSFLSSDIEEVKPYLFPMSSMTQEQKNSHNFLKHSAYANPIKLVDFYNKHHLDYRGLIPMGLAIDATGLNVY